MKVKKSGRLVPRDRYKYFREDNPNLWNDLRAGKEVAIDLSKILTAGIVVKDEELLGRLGLEEVKTTDNKDRFKLRVKEKNL